MDRRRDEPAALFLGELAEPPDRHRDVRARGLFGAVTPRVAQVTRDLETKGVTELVEADHRLGAAHELEHEAVIECFLGLADPGLGELLLDLFVGELTWVPRLELVCCQDRFASAFFSAFAYSSLALSFTSYIFESYCFL